MGYKLELGIIWDNKPEIDLPYITNLKDRFSHIHIIGRSGMGKSSLIERMVDYDMKSGISCIFLDPKGGSVDKLVNENCKYISFNHPVKLNPLRRKGYKVDTLIREFIDVMDIMITATTINPEATTRFKQILSKAIKGFREEDRSLHFLNEFLSFKDVRQSYPFADPMIRKWFNEIEDTKKSGFKLASEYTNSMASISSRLSQFLDNDDMSQFLTRGENEFNIEELFENGQSLLVNTKTSDSDNQQFLSALILYSVVSYIMSNTPKKPLMIYVDEFQSVVNSSFPRLLQYSRSSQVGFTLAHHDFQAIDPKVLSSIFGIVSTFIVFNCGDVEAKRMEDIVRVPKTTIMDLPKFFAYGRMGTSNTHFKTFQPLPEATPPAPEIVEIEELNFLSDEWIMI